MVFKWLKSLRSGHMSNWRTVVATTTELMRTFHDPIWCWVIEYWRRGRLLVLNERINNILLLAWVLQLLTIDQKQDIATCLKNCACSYLIEICSTADETWKYCYRLKSKNSSSNGFLAESLHQKNTKTFPPVVKVMGSVSRIIKEEYSSIIWKSLKSSKHYATQSIVLLTIFTSLCR